MRDGRDHRRCGAGWRAAGRSLAVVALGCGLAGCGALLDPDIRDVPRSRTAKAPPTGGTLTPVAAGAGAPVMIERTHVVVRGDTLYGVARQYGASPADIARLNGLQPPYGIRTGQVLRLPGQVPIPGVQPAVLTASSTGSVIDRMPTLPRTPSGEPRPDPAPRSGVTQVALAPPPPAVSKPADPPSSDLRAPEARAPEPRGVEPRPVAAPLGAAPPGTTLPGTGLPGVGLPGTGPTGAAPVPTLPAARPEAERGAPPPEVSPSAAATIVTAVPAPPPRSPSGFILPIEGKVISSYGPQPGGLSNDGINIAAPKGTPVRAADHGVVVYAGNELRGFGNMLLIRHSDGWMTAYAHLDSMAVGRGTRVARGQHIGAVGMTGNVTSPQLHFEIRQGKQPVDPEKQIAAALSSSVQKPRTVQLGQLR